MLFITWLFLKYNQLIPQYGYEGIIYKIFLYTYTHFKIQLYN